MRNPVIVPEDRGNGHADRQSFCRALAVRTIHKLSRERPWDIVRRAGWTDDHRLTRAPVSPATSPVTGVSQTHVGNLLLIAPQSAAAKLFAECMRLDFTGLYEIVVPYAASHATPQFVGEAMPINVVRSPTASTTVGPVKKLTFITSFTRELQLSSPENLSVILGKLLGEAAAKSLDAAVFGNSAATSAQPAGLLYGLTALAGSTGATTADSAAGDVAQFAQKMSDAFVDPQNMIVVTSPSSAMNIRMALGYQTPPLPILSSPAVPSGTAIGIAPEGIASGYEGTPEIEVVEHPNLHFDDSVPADIVNSSGVAASPDKSLFQADLTGIKLRVRCCWASIVPGAIQYATGIKW
jgi:hypothetical protein